MEIATRFSEQSLHELNRANRNWPYWPVRFVGHPRIFALLAGTGLFAVRSLYLGFSASPLDDDNLLTGFVLLALITAVIAVLLYRERAELRKKASSPQVLHLTIDDAGFVSRSSETHSARHEWSQFSSFSSGPISSSYG